MSQPFDPFGPAGTPPANDPDPFGPPPSRPPGSSPPPSTPPGSTPPGSSPPAAAGDYDPFGPKSGIPQAPPTSMSDDPMEPPSAAYSMSDDEAMRKIGRRTSPLGRVVFVLVLLGIATGGYLAYRSTVDQGERMACVDATRELEGEPFLAALRACYDEAGYSDVRERILLNLGHHRDAQAVPLFIRGLDEGGPVRVAAAHGLARVGLPGAEPSRQKLLQALADTDEGDRSEVVWTLALFREGSAAEAVLTEFTAGRLQSKEGFEPRVISEVLGPSRLMSDALLNHETEGVRMLTALALAEMANADVVEPLSRLITAELARGEDGRSAEVLQAAAMGLGRAGDPRAAAPLFALLQQLPSIRTSVLEGLRRSTGAPGVAVLVTQASDVTLQRDLVGLLAESHDSRVADTLAGLLTSSDAEIKKRAALALADLGDARASETLFALARESSESTADSAIRALGILGRREAASGLLALVRELPTRKAALLRALGRSGDPSAGPTLLAELAGDDVRSAALALADLRDDEGYRRLRAMLPRPANLDMSNLTVGHEMEYLNRRAAIDAMGFYGRPDVASDLMRIVEDAQDDPRLRASAAASLGLSATAELMAQVIAKVSDAALPPDTKRYYLQALYQRPSPELSQALLQVLGSDVPGEIKRPVGVALGYIGDQASDARLMELLDSEPSRPWAALAIALGGGAEAVRKLLTVLGEDRDASEILQMSFMADDDASLNLVTLPMFQSGQVFRRLHAAEILRDGLGEQSPHYGYGWVTIMALLRSGSEGPGGMTARQIREQFWTALTGEDAERRRIAAEVMAEIPERGLLLRARDEGQRGAEEARHVLLRLNRSN